MEGLLLGTSITAYTVILNKLFYYTKYYRFNQYLRICLDSPLIKGYDLTMEPSISETSPSNLSKFSFRSPVLIFSLIGAGIVLLTLLGALFFLRQFQKPETQTAVTTENTAKIPSPIPTEQQALPFPEVTFQSWKTEDQLVRNPEAVSSWKFTEPSKERGESIAAAIGMQNVISDDKTVKSVNGSNEEGVQSMYYYEIGSGAFLYSSSSGVKVQNNSASSVTGILKKINAYDDQIIVTATYERSSTPGVTYYELHHDWTKVGLPVLNEVGLTTLPVTTKVRNLKVGLPSETTDADIVNSSDGGDGKARQADFNTITVGVKSNAVVYIKSKMRNLQPAPKNIAVITAEEAIRKAEAGEYENMLAVPAGEGPIDESKVFPMNKGIGKEAIVSEAVLANIEKPMRGTQSELEPYWVLRGSSELDTGYTITFVALVKAQKNSVVGQIYQKVNDIFSLDVEAESSLLAQIQQGTLQRENASPVDQITPEGESSGGSNPREGTATQSPGSQNGNRRPTPEDFDERRVPTLFITAPDEYDIDFMIENECRGLAVELPYLTIEDRRVIDGYTFVKIRGDWHMEITEDTDVSIDFIDFIGRALVTRGDGAEEEQTLIRELFMIYDPNSWFQGVFDYVRRSDAEVCYLKITGLSPTLFYYGSSSISISPSQSTYSYPALIEGKWNVKPNGAKLAVNDVSVKKIYYEYLPSSEYVPENTGWVVEEKNLASFVTSLAALLQLTTEEKETLLFEVKQLYNEKKTSVLHLSLIPESHVGKIAPLTVQAKRGALPEVRRIMVSGSVPVTSFVTPQKVTPVHRTQNLLLEIGVYSSPK